jgi:predicted ATPase
VPREQTIITELRVKNLRTLADVRLRLDGLTVLIGDNGTGKSSLVEACEILRRAAGPAFGDEIFGVHGGPAALVRRGAAELSLGVRIEGGGEPLDYELSIDDGGQVSKEALVHPELLMRALDFFEAMARDRPVLLATHSDRLLDGLSEPARAAVLCELDEQRRTRLVRADKEALDRWLERYRGLGDLRAAGHQASVMTRAETTLRDRHRDGGPHSPLAWD